VRPTRPSPATGEGEPFWTRASRRRRQRQIGAITASTGSRAPERRVRRPQPLEERGIPTSAERRKQREEEPGAEQSPNSYLAECRPIAGATKGMPDDVRNALPGPVPMRRRSNAGRRACRFAGKTTRSASRTRHGTAMTAGHLAASVLYTGYRPHAAKVTRILPRQQPEGEHRPAQSVRFADA